MSRYIHDKTTHELIPVSGFGSRVATSVNGNTLKVHGGLLDIEGYNYGEGDITTAVQMIAPIESTLTASKAYAIGDQFVYEGLLYKATAAIASGAAIVIGTNASLADCVVNQIQNIINSVSELPTKTEVIPKNVGMTDAGYSWAISYNKAPIIANGISASSFMPIIQFDMTNGTSYALGMVGTTLYLAKYSNGTYSTNKAIATL